MAAELITSLWITLIGMVLVFGAIILLWLTMTILVHLTQEQHPDLQNTADKEPTEEQQRKQRAAAVAVAVALMSHTEQEKRNFVLPPTAIVSAWQLAMRGRQLREKGRIR